MPTYSEVTIEFLTDYDNDYTLKLATSISNVVSSNTWTWVTTRSSGFEVTKGTATANAGERTAINFEAAYDLDLTTGYVTTVQNTNEVLIQSETLGQDFVGFRGEDDNGNLLVAGVDYNVTYNNYVEPFDVGTVSQILARSPHYVNTPFFFDTTTKVTIDLKIYSGHFTNDEPSTSTQTITKIRPTVDYSEFNTNVSQSVANYLESSPVIVTSSTSQIVDSAANEVKWVIYTATYTDPQEEITSVTGYFGSSDGYGEYLTGVNPQYGQFLLSSTLRRKVDRTNGVILVPFVNDGTVTGVDVDTLPTAEYSQIHAVTNTEKSTTYVQYIQIDPSAITTDTSIEVTFKTAGGDTVITYDLVDECRYTPKTIVFKNKWGFYDTVTMFAKSVDSLNVEKSEFINNCVSAGTYSTTKHQNQDINITATKNVVCNSGHIKEAENDLYEQLLMSRYVWFYKDGSLIPVKPTTNQFTYKTRINDGLIEYQINFDYAYNLINNI